MSTACFYGILAVLVLWGERWRSLLLLSTWGGSADPTNTTSYNYTRVEWLSAGCIGTCMRAITFFGFSNGNAENPPRPPRAAHRPAYVKWMLYEFRSIRLLEHDSGSMTICQLTKPAYNKIRASWCEVRLTSHALKTKDGKKKQQTNFRLDLRFLSLHFLFSIWNSWTSQQAVDTSLTIFAFH